ncbi:E3 ubiquitin-protein ligase RNF10 [Culicoides brevitarsis]|uniref:E3 ubiquitin-protein ligase RNF10 n=1 Tax=Culicoides brevitarsis TaxID=469753 RepID=UPI00307C0F4D
MEKRSKVQASKSLTHVKKVQEYGPRFKNGQRNDHRREANVCKATGTVPKTKAVVHSRQRNVVQRKLVEYDETQELEDQELYSVYEQGSKKQNLNHLLNFHYSPREPPTNSYNSWSYHKNSKTPSHYPKYDKNQFLKANCQFVVKSHDDYKAFLYAPDILPLWNLIEQINMMMYENPQCPICLYPPTACKITKCGHYFCYSCVLHYLALGEKTWRKCPICNDAVTADDLKSLLIKPITYHNISDEIHFDLVKKETGSSFVIKSDADIDENVIPDLANNDVIYSKAVVASAADILQIIEREKHELTFELQTTDEEVVFIEQALESLKERERKITELAEKEETPPSTPSEKEKSVSDDTADKTESQFKYFYQLRDGQNLFLHPINVKMLETLFGNIKDCPSHISGTVVQKEYKTIDEGAWKRYKYLQHLPLSSNIEICEIQFTEPVVPEEVLDIFRDDIKHREARRKKKEHQENVRFRKINELNEKMMGFKFEETKADINIESMEQFPDAIVAGNEEDVKKKGPSTSFAKVLSSPKKKTIWPDLSSVPSTSSSTIVNQDDEAVNPANDIDFGNAIFEAIERGGTSYAQPKAKGKEKKGKNKKGTVLFATGLKF